MLKMNAGDRNMHTARRHACSHTHAGGCDRMTKVHVLFSHSVFFTELNMWHMEILFLSYTTVSIKTHE